MIICMFENKVCKGATHERFEIDKKLYRLEVRIFLL